MYKNAWRAKPLLAMRFNYITVWQVKSRDRDRDKQTEYKREREGVIEREN